jgi:hypothetical protein
MRILIIISLLTLSSCRCKETNYRLGDKVSLKNDTLIGFVVREPNWLQPVITVRFRGFGDVHFLNDSLLIKIK